VLLVDDEPSLLDVLQLGLREEFDVEIAADADQAEFLLAARPFDVIVCDHLMPDEEGLAFLVRARTQFPKVQRILLTGYMNPELLMRSTEIAGLAGCLMKPVATEELVEAIWMVLPR
jgi:DNA-binding NtrC family response regulator